MGFSGTQNSNFVGTHKKYPWQQAMGFCTTHWMIVGGREAGREAGFGGNNKNFSSLHRCLPLNQRQNPASLCQKNTLIERQERRNVPSMPLVILVWHANPSIARKALTSNALLVRRKKNFCNHRIPVCERRLHLLVCSLPLHRHSYIGFIFRFRFIDS